MDKRQDNDRSILPNKISIRGKDYYYETWYNDSRFKSRNYKCPSDYNLFYIDYKSNTKLISIWGISRKDCINKMYKYLKDNQIIFNLLYYQYYYELHRKTKI